MAKYIKTEEGYKLFKEIEDNTALVGGEFIEIKDDVIDTNYGKLISEGNITTNICLNTTIGNMYSNASFANDYCCSLQLVSPINNFCIGEEYDIEITGKDNSFFSTTKALLSNVSVGVASYYADYGLSFTTKINGKSSNIRICFINNSKNCYIISLVDLSDCHIKIYRVLGQKSQYVYLPKTALEYDDKPRLKSENVIKSGAIYDAIQDVRLLSGKNVEIKDGVISAIYGEQGMVETVFTTKMPNYTIKSWYSRSEVNMVTYFTYRTSELYNAPIPPVNTMTIKIATENTTYLDVTLENISGTQDGRYEYGDYVITYELDNPIACFIKTPISLHYYEPTVSISFNYPTEIMGTVKLPKTALDYDESPIEDSDNLLTSGSIYNTISNLQSQITSIPKFSISVVTELPTTDISTTTVYLVKDTEDEGNLYTEYIYVNDTWEKLGTQSVEFDNVVTEDNLVTEFEGTDVNYEENQVYNANVVNEVLNGVVELFESKQDLLQDGENIKTINGESMLGAGDISIGGGSTDEEWVELLNTTLAEDVAYVDLVAPDDKMFKKLHILISTEGAGLSASSKIEIRGSNSSNAYWNNPNAERLTVTQNAIGTWRYPIFIIEKGEFFPIALACDAGVNGYSSAPIYMGGVGQNNSLAYKNSGPWKIIRIQPQSDGVVLRANVRIYAWGVYE